VRFGASNGPPAATLFVVNASPRLARRGSREVVAARYLRQRRAPSRIGPRGSAMRKCQRCRRELIRRGRTSCGGGSRAPIDAQSRVDVTRMITAAGCLHRKSRSSTSNLPPSTFSKWRGYPRKPRTIRVVLRERVRRDVINGDLCPFDPVKAPTDRADTTQTMTACRARAINVREGDQPPALRRWRSSGDPSHL
jgi:hypothetical protein